MRACGVLMPIFSLPGQYGIGSLGYEARRFADQMKAAGQSYWQVLPMGPTGAGDSPYQSYSTFAGCSYYIDLDTLVEEGLLTPLECEETDYGDWNRVPYAVLKETRDGLLKKAFSRSDFAESEDFRLFEEKEDWLQDYAMFMAIHKSLGGIHWNQWPEEIRLRKPEAMKRYAEELKEEILFEKFVQFKFFEQWNAFKAYTEKIGLKLIGDLPIYVSPDSADCWAQPELFQYDEDLQLKAVAGCPPDGFSETGQHWGNPLYNWTYHKKTGFTWWIKRMGHMFRMFDLVRLDHFRGIDEYYSIPANEKTAINGKWEKGPGMDLFRAMKEVLGELPVIAEDLGFLTDTVKQLLEDSGFPGMKVLQFAFGEGQDNFYQPHRHKKNCVVYTGTHDNQTTAGWIKTMPAEELAYAAAYLNHGREAESLTVEDVICAALGSCAELTVIPIQDYLGLDDSARINVPGTPSGNWSWRMKWNAVNKARIDSMRRLASLYSRIPK